MRGPSPGLVGDQQANSMTSGIKCIKLYKKERPGQAYVLGAARRQKNAGERRRGGRMERRRGWGKASRASWALCARA